MNFLHVFLALFIAWLLTLKLLASFIQLAVCMTDDVRLVSWIVFLLYISALRVIWYVVGTVLSNGINLMINLRRNY